MPDSGFFSGIGRPASEPSQDRAYRKLRRAADFPYDKPTSYGAPRGIDNMGGGFQDVSQQHSQNPPLPKDLNHSPWDEETGELEQEATGYPGLFGKSADSGMGGTIPGTAGGWAGSTRDWDAEDAVERAGTKRLKNESAWGRLMELGNVKDYGIEETEITTEDAISELTSMFGLPEESGKLPDGSGFMALSIDTDRAESEDEDGCAECDDMYRRWASYPQSQEQR